MPRRWRWALLLAATLLVSSSLAIVDNLKKPAPKTVMLSNEAEADGEELAYSASDFVEEDVPEKATAAAVLPTPGEEYTFDKTPLSVPTTENERHAEDLYKQALRFLERGRPQGAEAKKAAYRLLAQAAELKHRDAMKLMAYAHLFGDRARWSIEEARKLFEELAREGSPDAQLGLAFLHATGLGFPESNQGKALVYYSFAAQGGNPLAQMALGYRYYSGVTVAHNCEKALTWYAKVAKKVADAVKFSTGGAIQRIRLPDEMEPSSPTGGSTLMDNNLLEYYKFLADKGDVSAQVGLGQLYLSGGRGVEQNFDEALKYLTAAAEGGNAAAFAHLGKMYLDGTPATPQDNHTAFQFFAKSADKGNHIGQAGLGVMYLYGRGVKRDYEKALKLFTLASEQGWVDGQLYLGVMHYKGLGVRRDFKAAVKYFQMATQNGHVHAYYNLGQMHASGLGVQRNCQTAVELYKNVAERGRWSERLMEAYSAYKDGRPDESANKYLFMAELGYEPAQTNFAYILDRGETSVFTSAEVLERALLHWQRAANQDYPMARVKLGDYHYYGWGTPSDYAQAAAQYKVAAERHSTAQAMFNLGYMHEQGLGIDKDIYLAKRFYDMAAEHSADAVVPVTLALMKLALLFLVDYINENPLVASLESSLGANWDLYILTITLSSLIALVIFYRRRQPTPADGDDPAPDELD